MIVNMHEAKTHLCEYVEKALAGEEVLLARAGEPIVALVPLASLPPGKCNNVIFGVMEDAFDVPDDFDAPLPTWDQYHELDATTATAPRPYR